MQNKRFLISLLLICTLVTFGWGANAGDKASADFFPQLFTQLAMLSTAILSLGALFVVIRAMQMIVRDEEKRLYSQQGLTYGEAAAGVAGESIWTRLRKKYWEDAVPVEREGEIVFHHEFDGIRELDNNLPPWWVNLFYVTIIFAAVYMFYYHFSGRGPGSLDEYQQEMAVAKKEAELRQATKADDINETNVTVLTDKDALEGGKKIYVALCVACHGQGGEGSVGPNLTDDYWLHGGGVKNVFKTIKYGVPEKGMISWQTQIRPGDMQKVASYILTLHGTNPPNPKAPQGDLYKEEAAAPAPQ